MPQATERCAYCRRHKAVDECLPFCSERCKMADLGHWLTGNYRLDSAPGDPFDSESDEESEANDTGNSPGRES